VLLFFFLSLLPPRGLSHKADETGGEGGTHESSSRRGRKAILNAVGCPGAPPYWIGEELFFFFFF